jgi:hypothetical protein
VALYSRIVLAVALAAALGLVLLLGALFRRADRGSRAVVEGGRRERSLPLLAPVLTVPALAFTIGEVELYLLVGLILTGLAAQLILLAHVRFLERRIHSLAVAHVRLHHDLANGGFRRPAPLPGPAPADRTAPLPAGLGLGREAPPAAHGPSGGEPPA